MTSVRTGRAACVALALCGGAPACGAGRPPPVLEDASASEASACLACREAGAPGDAAGDVADTPPGDASGGDAGTEAGPPVDAAADAPSDAAVEAGACVAAVPDIKVANEARVLPRPVFVEATASGFVAGARAQRAGTEGVFFTRIGADGTVAGSTDVSQALGASVAGGALARDGAAGFVVAYDTNATDPAALFLRRVDAMGVADATAVHVSDAPAQDAQVVATPTGWIAAWRVVDLASGATRLSAATVASADLAVGTIATLTPPEHAPSAFALAADGSRVAVAYVDRGAATADVRVVPVGADGAASGAIVDLTSGAHVADTVAAVVRGDALVALWAEPAPTAALHVRRVDLGTRVADPTRDLGAAGMQASTPGLAADREGYVVAFRAPAAMGGSGRLGMLRLDGALAPREGASWIGPASLGDAVHVAASGTGLYAVGWANQTSSSTVAIVQLVRCP